VVLGERPVPEAVLQGRQLRALADTRSGLQAPAEGEEGCNAGLSGAHERASRACKHPRAHPHSDGA
jgi:hypothetical protein